MPTPTPTSEPYLPKTGDPDDGDETLDASGEGFGNGFVVGEEYGYIQGRNWTWDIILICMGNAVAAAQKAAQGKAKGKAGDKVVKCYLGVLSCILEMDQLPREDLKLAADAARKTIADSGLKVDIEKVVKDHWQYWP